MHTIKQQFASFKIEVMQKDAPQIQIDEMEIAFHAGFLTAKNTLIEMVDEQLSDQEFNANLNKLHLELTEFTEKLRLNGKP